MTEATLPFAIRAGEPYRYLIVGGRCPATAGYSLKLELSGQRQRMVLESTAQGEHHLLHAPGTVTARWPAGVYTAHLAQFKGRGLQWRQKFWLLLVRPAAPHLALVPGHHPA